METSLASLEVLAEGSLEMTPVPEQGASKRTRSKPFITDGILRPSWEHTTVLVIPSLEK